MTYSSETVLTHVQNQAYDVLDAYFNDLVVPPPINHIGGGLNAAVKEQSIDIQNQFAEIMAGGGGCEQPVVPNPNGNFLPTLKIPEGGNPAIDAGNFPEFAPVQFGSSRWPF
jgi:hypothetical protein